MARVLRFVDYEYSKYGGTGSPVLGEILLDLISDDYCMDIEFDIPSPDIEWRDPAHRNGREVSRFKYPNINAHITGHVYGTDKADLSTNIRALFEQFNASDPILEWRPEGWADSLFIDLIDPPIDIDVSDWFEAKIRDNPFINVLANVDFHCEAKPFGRRPEETLVVFEQKAPNGDMENWTVLDPDDWTETVGVGCSINEEIVEFWHGVTSAEMIRAGGNDCYMTTTAYIPVDITHHYHFDAFALADAGTPTLRLQVLCYDAVPALLGTLTIVSAATSTTWYQHAHQNDADMGVIAPGDFPAGTTQVLLRIEVLSDATIYVDQIYFGDSEYAPQHRVESPCSIVVPPDDVLGDVSNLADVYLDEVFWNPNAIILGQRDKYHAEFDGVIEPTDGTDTQDSNVCLTQDYERYDIPANLVVNPSLELTGAGDPDFWLNWGETRQAGFMGDGVTFGIAYSGTHSMWILGDGTNQQYITSDVINPINPALDYYCSMYVYRSGGLVFDFPSLEIRAYAGAAYLGTITVWNGPHTAHNAWARVGRTIYASEWPIGTDRCYIRLGDLTNNAPLYFYDLIYLTAATPFAEVGYPLESSIGRYLPTAGVSVSAAVPGDSILTLQKKIESDTLGDITNISTDSTANFGDPNTDWVAIALQSDRWDLLNIPTSHVSEQADLTAMSQVLRFLLNPAFDDTRDFWVDYLCIIPIDQSFLQMFNMTTVDHIIIDCRSNFVAPLVSLDGTFDSATTLDGSKWTGESAYIVDPDGMNLVWLALYDNSNSMEPRCIQNIKLKYDPLYLLVSEE